MIQSQMAKVSLVIAATLAAAAAIGFVLSIFSQLAWLSGFCLTLIAFLLIGAWLFEDSEVPGGLEHDPEGWESGESQRRIRINNTVNYSIIGLLVLVVIWTEVGT